MLLFSLEKCNAHPKSPRGFLGTLLIHYWIGLNMVEYLIDAEIEGSLVTTGNFVSKFYLKNLKIFLASFQIKSLLAYSNEF